MDRYRSESKGKRTDLVSIVLTFKFNSKVLKRIPIIRRNAYQVSFHDSSQPNSSLMIIDHPSKTVSDSQ